MFVLPVPQANVLELEIISPAQLSVMFLYIQFLTFLYFFPLQLLLSSPSCFC